MNRERRIGMLLLGAGLVIALAILAVAVSHERQTLYYTVLFDDAKGVQPGDKAQISGVDVGSVKWVHLQTNPSQVEVRLKVNPQYARQVRADSTAVIRNVSFPNVSGQRVIEIINPDTTPAPPPLARDAIVKGVGGELDLTLWKVQHNLSDAGDDVSHAIGAISRNIQRLGKSVEEIVTRPEVQQAIGDLKRFSLEMKDKGQAAAIELNRQWPRIRAEVQPILKDLENFGRGTLAAQLRQMMAEVDRTLRAWNDQLERLPQPPTPTPLGYGVHST